MFYFLSFEFYDVYILFSFSAADDEEQKKNDPNYELCPTCGRYISKMAMMMHSLNCARRNWLCTICNVVLEKKQKNFHIHCPDCTDIFTSQENLDRHIELKHALQPCPQCSEMVSTLFYSS